METEIKLIQDKAEEINSQFVKSSEKIETLENEISMIKKSNEVLTEKFQKIQVQEQKGMSVKDGILNFLNEKNIKSVSDLKNLINTEFQIKADNPVTNTSYTGDYGRTKPVSALRFANERPKAFINQGITVGNVETGKNILLWTVGAFTEVVGYASELVSIVTGGGAIDGSGGVATDKTRQLAKIAARMIMSAETFEDLPQFAARLEAKLLEKIELWLDEEMYIGDGNNSTAPKHIYGLIPNQVTAFSTANSPKYENANIADLVGAAELQAEDDNGYVNTVWMSNRLANLLRHTKDLNGNYIIQMIDGVLSMGEHRVIKNKIFRKNGVDSMLVGNLNSIQLWVKRQLDVEFLRVPGNDSYEMYLYMRGQALVEDEDIKSLIYIANVDTAITAITA